MRFLLYFLVYSCLVIGLFTTFLYLMTVVDPGLLQLPEKAARMMKTNSEGVHESPGVLTMGKGRVCIGVFCTCTIALFIVMIYLMMDINPPPLKAEDDTNKNEIKDNQELKFESVIFDDAPTVEVLQYGIEKYNNKHLDYTPYIPPTATGTALYDNLWKFTPRKVIPPLWPVTTIPFFGRRPTMSSPENITSTQYNNTESWEDANIYNSTTDKISENGTEISNTNFTSVIVPVKRSVREFRKSGNFEIPQPIILKILDEGKQFKIEIKLGPSETKRKRYRENRSSLKNKSKLTMLLQSQSTDDLLLNDLAENTVINIMPNESVIVNEYDYYDNVSGDNTTEKGLTEINKEINKTDIVYSNSSVNQTITTYNTIAYENIIINKTKNVDSNILDLRNNITDYENLLFNKTEHIDSNILAIQNITTQNIADRENFVLQYIKQNRYDTTVIPIYKDIFTLNVLFDNKTKSFHSGANDEEDHHSIEISNNSKRRENTKEFGVFRTEVYNHVTISNTTTATMDLNNYSTVNTEKTIKQNENSMPILATGSYSSIFDTESTVPMKKNTSQNESVTDRSINAAPLELSTDDVNLILLERSTIADERTLQ